MSAWWVPDSGARAHEMTYETILGRCGGEREILSNNDRLRLLQNWREVFAVGLHAATGKWKRGEYEWHVFSFGDARALCGEKVMMAYSQERPAAFIVCPEEAGLSTVAIRGGSLPDFRPLADDFCVWPEDLSWTMAFTHEESAWLGPYFCRADWVADVCWT